MTGSGACAHCQAPLGPEATVHLWDGKDYCRACVEDACEGMADYAAAHPVLEEVLPFLPRKFLRGALVCTLLNVLIVSAIVYPFVALSAFAPDAMGVLIFLALIVLALTLLHFLIRWLNERERSEMVQVADARVRILRSGEAFVSLFWFGSHRDEEIEKCTFALSECRWYVWRFRRPAFSLRRNAELVCLLLADPFFRIEDPERTRYCGHNPEMLRIWQGFLTLAGLGRPLGLWQTWWQPPAKLRGGQYAAARREASA